MNEPQGMGYRFRAFLFITALLALLICPAGHSAPRVPWTTSRVVGSPNPPAPLRVERIFPKLKFDAPVDAGPMPGSDLIFVLEQRGKLYSFPSRVDSDRANLVFDFSAHQPFDSAYSFAFHPEFSENHFLFVCYVEPEGRTNGSHISRFTLRPSTPPVIDPKSESIILRWLSGGHNGCKVAFGNDGFLYISTGDGASPDPPDFPYKTGQDISDLLSSILRIDVDHVAGRNTYSIPTNNPFITTTGARPEVYAFGLRNPWRFSFDRATGDLWLGDVGWEQWEMIYRIKSGGNYGWSIVEGPNTHVRTDVQPGPGPIQTPLIALPHSEAASITGGLIYHGKKLPLVRGGYVYGDWETGKFWVLRNKGDQLISNDELCATSLKPVSFTEDHNGEILIVDYNGGLYTFVTNSAPAANAAFPQRLSETGVFSDMASLKPSSGVVPYHINAQMWSDSARAERLLGVPGEGIIITENGRETIAGRMWDFPSNTVFCKTLTLEMEQGNPASRRRVETQLLHFDGQSWNAYTFRWNAAQTDAELVPKQGTNEVFMVKDPGAPGGHREIAWRFVGRAECYRCHTSWAGETLSFNWLQLKTTGPDPELHRLEQLGLLRVQNPPNPLAGLASPYDVSAPLPERARAWLHVNCGTCHRNGAGGGIAAQFNYEMALDQMRAIDARPTRGDFGIVGARVIASGAPERSTLFYRISTEGSGRMPAISSRMADVAGVRVIGDWIRSMSTQSDPEADAVAGIKLSEENAARLARLQDGSEKEAMAKIIETTSGAIVLLDEATKPGAPSKIVDAIAAAGARHPNAVVRDLLQRLLPPAQRRRTLGTDIDPQSILTLKGDAARGKILFHQEGGAQCARCHRFDGLGREYGPDLTNIGRKYTRAQVLEQIILPSKIIAPEFKTYFLTLRDGTQLTGLIVKRPAGELVLRGEDLIERRLKADDVKETHESSLSSMPEGLLGPLTAQEAADLLEYLDGKNP